MTEKEYHGLMILLCIVGVTLLVAYVLHEIEERRYYKRMRLKAERQRREIFQKIKEGKL